MGKILRIDLTTGKIGEEKMPNDDIVRKYLGGYGLALRYAYDEVPVGRKPIDPRMPIIFFTGPLTGSHFPGGTNTSATGLNYDTGFTAGRSHSHGWFGIRMKYAGYDGLIIKGRANKPVYLWVHDDTAEIRDASKVWGKDSHESEDLIREEIGKKDVCVATIGPAGENLCAGGMIGNDKNHAFSHSGMGDLMGSKNLKAIAVSGSKNYPSLDEKREREIASEYKKMQALALSSPANSHKNGGIARSDYHLVTDRFTLCYKNMQTTLCPEFGKGWSNNKITPKPCYRCHIGCSYDLEVTSGPHKGYVATLAGGGESLEGAACMVGIIDEPGTIFYLTDLYDRLGFEASTLGCTLSMAFEAYEKGLITKEDTDGLELKWGDAEVVEKLVRKTAKREGFGDILARGPKEAAEIIGGDAPNFVVHSKGAGINLHDWRCGWGVLFGQIVGSGSGWLTWGADIVRAEPEAGYPERNPPFDWKIKPEEVRRTAHLKHAVDCVGLCTYHTVGVPGAFAKIAEAISTVTGWNFTREELLEVGARIFQLERAFNVKHGLVPGDDLAASRRLIEAPQDGPAKGKSIAPHLHGMVMQYYELCGWDKKTGKPWKDALEKVGLDDVASDLWG
jgi:aldehyde:ferredoxin oxidoreductase